MSLSTGALIGHYEVEALLGAGGMGEVYRARDTRLDRSVAIKSLPEALARDADRLARFEREARILASLDHPHIAGIHGLEEVAGTPYLVLEFVDGETLAQRLARGALTVRETLELGSQVASAVAAAHERGIVHRDLKPGNVMLTAARGARVLDFGLAKGSGAEGGSGPQLSVTPTAAMNVTGEGIILGTAPYMSPEQARGRAVDRRADVWAFGCILFECLTARQTFAGETVSDVIARILEREPEWATIPASVPPRLRDLVKRCLTKDLDERPRDIGDLGRELDAIAAELSGARASTAGSTAAGRPSLAVLYFENPTKDQESEYFCAGITEDILTDLSKIKGLRVASRSAVARYRGAPVDVPRVAGDLGVGAVLEGSVRRAGDRVRITAQLISAADGFQLWAERYDRKLEDVFAVQEEIASSIAEALRVALTPGESQNLVTNRPNDVRAYDLYLKGREAYGHYTADSLRQALNLFHQAAAIDGTYALAWAGIADCHGQMQQWGGASDPREAIRLGLEAAERAIALNPRLPEAYKAKALVLRFSGDREGSKAALVKAVEADPRFLPALINLGVEAFCRADLAATERLVRRTLDVDPQDPFATTWLALLMQLTRREGEVPTLARRIRQLSDDTFYISASHVIHVQVAMAGGDVAGARRMVQDAAEDGADPQSLRCLEAEIAAREGRTEEARALVTTLAGTSGLGSGALLSAAMAAVRIGDHEAARGFLARPLLHDLAPTLVRLNLDLHPLLGREPFAPRRWEATMVWPLEAPMIDPARHSVFREVRIESGKPQGTSVLRGET